MQKLAIIGTGIAGMGCAHLLQHNYNITLFEKDSYVGGHTNTITADENGKTIFIDTGFMVFNFETYPNLCKLFKEINAPVKKTNMSFSVQYAPTNLEYCGSGLNGLFAQRKNIFNIKYIKMLSEITRFNKISVQILDNPSYESYSVAQYIKEFKFSEDMLIKYLIPMSSAVWSTPMDKMLDFPIITLIRFFKNHGFLGLNTQHQWYTLHNGSQAYREILIKPFKDKIQLNNGAVSVKKLQGGKALVSSEDGTQHEFDKVIFATHADVTLSLLAEPTADEEDLLSVFKYEKNKAIVHTDETVMPKNKRTWSSWNYRIEEKNGKQIPTTIYWMNQLQGVSDKVNYFVSINAIQGSIHPSKVIKEINYEHPLFNVPAMNAQNKLHKLNATGPLFFCGSYFKYGFHEDAYKSAVDLCELIKDI